jgi:transcriptional regulator with XRE-family HTH domain
VTRGQCRAARAFLDWTLDDLADQAAVGRGTIHAFEAGHRTPRRATLKALQLAFEAAGLEFFENGKGPSVRLRRDAAERIESKPSTRARHSKNE